MSLKSDREKLRKSLSPAQTQLLERIENLQTRFLLLSVLAELNGKIAQLQEQVSKLSDPHFQAGHYD